MHTSALAAARKAAVGVFGAVAVCAVCFCLPQGTGEGESGTPSSSARLKMLLVLLLVLSFFESDERNCGCRLAVGGMATGRSRPPHA